ncbi:MULTISPECIES: hypothetical protein [Thermoanaerobacterium]|uniref:Uncharacterized protein n=3 Tax=Thermoanaerobacterium TaxID=28895 RepID=L0INL9_THETR|nr:MULTISPECIES: hypothetical protein [Thermoanaerobacterium]AFK94284.1 hypothetical protein Tsac_2737 [Thermoanaerobacterium saccharolyticum JW/SL-YS485]AGB20458.1 hypothetical protein Thethe_02912 [Thermoanaerobacterium thermosaccharolyticum M0795]ETO39077.1 hypothetical protein V518_0784 [Thermoanaerobacterium aotearoense SCUT27]
MFKKFLRQNNGETAIFLVIIYSIILALLALSFSLFSLFSGENIISQHINNQSTKTYNLINTDDYYLAKGFIDNKMYYIFEAQGIESDKGYLTALVSDSDIVYDNKNYVQITKINVTQTYKLNILGIKRTRTIERYHYTFHIPNDKIKDYGVIKEKTESNTTILPFFIPIYTR